MSKYAYKRKDGTVLAESDSPIKFNLALFPIFKDIEPEVVAAKSKSSSYSYKNKKEE